MTNWFVPSYLQNLKHQVEKEGFLKMKLQKQEAWRTYYCRLSNGGIDLYSFDNGTQFQGRVLVKSSPVITKVRSFTFFHFRAGQPLFETGLARLRNQRFTVL